MKVFTEIGLGNTTFLSTEYESDKEEYRVPRFEIPKNVHGYYVRVWIGGKVFVISTNDGFEVTQKDKKKFKILLGVSGSIE